MGLGATVLTEGAAGDRYVLHVVPANGGGVDRYVRDICAYRPLDCILHVAAEQCVFELVASQQYVPIDRAQFLEATLAKAVGSPLVLHVHSTLAPTREIVTLLRSVLKVGCVLSLHDVEFAAAETVGEAERRERTSFVTQAVERVVPSPFISELLTSVAGSDLSRQIVENGVDDCAVTNVGQLATDVHETFQVAVVGAVGPHKGLDFLVDVVASLPSEVRVLIIGYADGQLTSGWLVDDRIWVHGAFEPSELPEVVRRHGCQLAFFPNLKPESYCYALSDAWCAGLPALGPDVGAIGERLALTRAGWIYDRESGAREVASMLMQCLGDSRARASSVDDARRLLMTRTEMVQCLNQIYENAMMNTDLPPQPQALGLIAATHLNGQFFRSELQKMAGDLAFAHQQLANANATVDSLTQEYEARGGWIGALETRLEEYQREIERIEAARKFEHEQAEASRLTVHAAHEAYAAKLQRDVTDTLATAHQQQRAMATYEHALSVFPPVVKRWIMRRAAQQSAAKKLP